MTLLRAVLFETLNTLFALSIVCNGLLMCPLAFYSNALYRAAIQPIEASYGCLLSLLNYLFADNRMVVSGENEFLKTYRGKMAVISNHQIYPDWWYIWLFAWFHGASGDLKIFMMEWLKYIPIFGQGFWIFEFVMMKQKWEKDKKVIKKTLHKAKKAWTPLWMLIFPEGTLNTPHNREKSKLFAKKNDIADHPVNVILPRSTGLFYCVNALLPDIEFITDLTVGYYPLKQTDIPYDAYLMDVVFHDNKPPKKVYIHVRKYVVKDLPGFKEEDMKESEAERIELFSQWLRGIWMEKDEILSKFYNDGSFNATNGGKETELHPFPKPVEFLVIFGMYSTLFVTLPLYWWLLKIVLKLFWAMLFSRWSFGI